MSEGKDKILCSAQVSSADGWHSHRCSNPAKLEHGGKPYCKVHDPQKDIDRREKWSREFEQRKAEGAHLNRIAALERAVVETAVEYRTLELKCELDGRFEARIAMNHAVDALLKAREGR